MRLSAEQFAETGHKTEHVLGVPGMLKLRGLRTESQRGFTLVELITVIVIIGILAVAAVPRFFDNDVFQARGTADQVRAALRYGQKVAIAQHRNVIVTITSAAIPDCGTALTGGNIACAVSNKVTISPPITVTFNALGQPVPPNTVVTSVVGSTTITVEAETGYVH
jgi:MSHA pilin protein MshC